MTGTLSKYAPAIIQFAIVLVGAFAQLTHRLTLVDALQLVPLAANAVLVYFAPLFGANMRSGWKTGVAVLGALAAAAIPYATTGNITGTQVAVVILAGLQVLGAHVGVQIRNDSNGTPTTSTSSAGRAPVTELPEDLSTTRLTIPTSGN